MSATIRLSGRQEGRPGDKAGLTRMMSSAVSPRMRGFPDMEMVLPQLVENWGYEKMFSIGVDYSG